MRLMERSELLKIAQEKVVDFLVEIPQEQWPALLKVAADAFTTAPEEILMLMALDESHIQIDSIGLVRVYNDENVLLAMCAAKD